MGDSVLHTRPSPFHIIRPVARTDAKLRICSKTCLYVSNFLTSNTELDIHV